MRRAGASIVLTPSIIKESHHLFYGSFYLVSSPAQLKGVPLVCCLRCCFHAFSSETPQHMAISLFSGCRRPLCRAWCSQWIFHVLSRNPDHMEQNMLPFAYDFSSSGLTPWQSKTPRNQRSSFLSCNLPTQCHAIEHPITPHRREGKQNAADSQFISAFSC